MKFRVIKIGVKFFWRYNMVRNSGIGLLWGENKWDCQQIFFKQGFIHLQNLQILHISTYLFVYLYVHIYLFFKNYDNI